MEVSVAQDPKDGDVISPLSKAILTIKKLLSQTESSTPVHFLVRPIGLIIGQELVFTI